MAGYSKAEGSHYAIASGCADAATAAAAVLDVGGTIVDAAIAGSAVQCVTSPHLVSLGGDLFAVVKFAKESTVWSVNATGAAPMRASIELFAAQGHDRIPAVGPLSVQSPGLVAGWALMHRRWGRRPLAELLEPAVTLARTGSKVRRRLGMLSARHAQVFAGQLGWADVFTPDGKALREGDTLKQERLALALEQIARGGAGAFYEGAIARDIVDSMRRAGGIMEQTDLAAVNASIVPALVLRIGGLEIATEPPVSQGVVLLRAISLLYAALREGRLHDEAELAVAGARALRRAFSERLKFLGDSSDSRMIAESMLDGTVGAVPPIRPFAHDGPETTTLSILDSEGNAISLINSVFADFGSGVVTEEHGILLNNRLCAFFLDPKHPNSLQPGKRAIQTLHSVIVRDGNGVFMAGGSPGGDHQPQVNLQVLGRVLLGKVPLEAAVAAPRWALHPGTHPQHLAAQGDMGVQYEPDVPDNVLAALQAEGLAATEIADIGSAKWVTRRQASGPLLAVADHRRDGAVAAF